MIVKRELKTRICLVLVLLLAFAGISAAAEETDEKELTAQQALDAYAAQDYETTLSYLTQLADAGDPEAQCLAAAFYLYGLGAEQD